MIRRLLGSALIAIVVVPPCSAAAQETTVAPLAMPGPDVEQRLKQKRDVVLPKPSDETVARDMDQATRELSEPERTDRLIGQGGQRAVSRPEMDSAVVNGIQAENAARALKRR
jgi:hypothetical protein